MLLQLLTYTQQLDFKTDFLGDTPYRTFHFQIVDLDFEIDSSKGYTHVDYKTPIDFQNLSDKKGIDVPNFPSLETVAYNTGKKLLLKKRSFVVFLTVLKVLRVYYM